MQFEYRQTATCGHTICQKIATPTPGFKVQPPSADGGSKDVHSSKQPHTVLRRRFI
jgi:hypothetical protein